MTHDTRSEQDLHRRLIGLLNHVVDVVIIGAGINGAGLFRDLCEQGVTCLIVDKSDFGSGTSAASSRLIHGGLKYLETGELRLVAQSTLERNLLLKNAPHNVSPLLTVIPIFSWVKGIRAALGTLFGMKSLARSRGALLIKVGLFLYDFYGSRERVMPKHHILSRKEALKEFPGLTRDIVAAGSYYDAQVKYPERLVWELIRDGLDANPRSAALNYTQISHLEKDRLRLKADDGQCYEIATRLVVNAAGPWIDTVNAELGASTRYIGGTKGSHILLDLPELVDMLKGRMIYFETDNGRICLVYEYNGFALVGTTDQKAADPDTVVCEAWEIDYFLEQLRVLLPDMAISRDQIVFAYSGIRPLPASDTATPGLISRDHSSPRLEANDARSFPIISLVGGKWTTFRGFAEEITDTVLATFGKKRLRSTRDLPIGGGRNFPSDKIAREQWLAHAEQATGLSKTRLDELLMRYGTKAMAIASHKGPFTDHDRLPNASGYSLAELDWIIDNEAVSTMADLVLRRTIMAFEQAMSKADLDRIGELFATIRGWTADEMQDQVKKLTDELVQKHMRIV